MLIVLIVGILMNLVALPLAAGRVLFLYREVTAGAPAPERIDWVKERIGRTVKRQAVEVLGQRKMLTWTLPGLAHFFVMWAFFILATVYLELYGSLIKLLIHGGDAQPDWAIPIVGHWWLLGFLQDFIAVMCVVGLATFTAIRIKNAPKELGRKSRFFGSHLGPAWFTLFMIFNVIWTLFVLRGASSALGNLPYKSGAFVSIGVGNLLDGLPHGALETIEGVGIILHLGVMLGFLLFVLNSKHLHIFIAPLNVMFGRYPIALGAAKPMTDAQGKPVTLEDLEDLDEDAVLGVGSVEQFSWKGILDFNTCTECGRCQSQCPAWNTEKPLSPKLLIMALRDATSARAPYLMANESKREQLVAADAPVGHGGTTLTKELERPLVGDTGDEWFYMPEDGSGVIDPDVLWSCVTCGACVQQCPVDIEHVDHIVDMRRYQVLVESNFPAELNGLFKGLESKGNPWNMSASARMDWAKDLPFEVKVVGEDVETLDEVEWLFWVGCAGAYEDRAKKTTRAVAELLDTAGVSFAVLGNGETCTGDSARRAGNEFVFQGLAQQNIETFKEHKVKKVVSTCAHCFNTLKNEYKQLGYELEVVHHTQLLNRLVREKKLAPVAAPSRNGNGAGRTVTYHDPCYIGRHNQVYEAPRELLNVLPDADFKEMPRNSERSFCCGAGGARMWMEEKIGARINDTRTKEAVATGADQIAVACPFCRVMLSDGLTMAQSNGEAREEVEVLDVAQMLLASIKGEAPKKAAAPKDEAAQKNGAKVASNGKAGTTTPPAPVDPDPTAEDTKDEPEEGDVTQTENTVTDTADVGPAAKASGGSSLFDLGGDEDDAEPEAKAEKKSGGSLFDLGDDEDDGDDGAAEVEAPAAKAEPAEQPAAKKGGSLFDIEDDAADAPAPAAKTAETPEPAASSGTVSTPAASIPKGSLFDIEADESEAETPAPAAKAGEDPAGDSTTDEPVDRSEDDADTSAETQAKPEPEAKSESSGTGAVSTPAASIPKGSLFDVEADESEAAAPAPAAKAAQSDTEPEEKAGEDPAGDSTTDEPVDRSQDDTDTDVQQEAPADGGEVTAASVAPAGKGYAKGRSMFDIAARSTGRGTEIAAPSAPAKDPESPTSDGDSTAATDEPAPEAEPEPEAKVEPGSEPAAETPIRSLKDIKAAAQGKAAPEAEPTQNGAPADEPEMPTEEPSTETAEEEALEDETSEEPKTPKSTSNSETHTPKTNVEIGKGSLFDL